MDALAPTTVPHSAKYIPIIDKHVVSKVFDEVRAHTEQNKIYSRLTSYNTDLRGKTMMCPLLAVLSLQYQLAGITPLRLIAQI